MTSPARTPPLGPPLDARARADRFDATHNPPANVNAAKPDEGKVLSRVARPDGTEFRVSLHTYNGQPFIRLAPWSNGWPVKGKGTTVKVRELGSVVKGLLDAMEDLDGSPTR